MARERKHRKELDRARLSLQPCALPFHGEGCLGHSAPTQFTGMEAYVIIRPKPTLFVEVGHE